MNNSGTHVKFPDLEELDQFWKGTLDKSRKAEIEQLIEHNELYRDAIEGYKWVEKPEEVRKRVNRLQKRARLKIDQMNAVSTTQSKRKSRVIPQYDITQLAGIISSLVLIALILIAIFLIDFNPGQPEEEVPKATSEQSWIVPAIEDEDRSFFIPALGNDEILPDDSQIPIMWHYLSEDHHNPSSTNDESSAQALRYAYSLAIEGKFELAETKLRNMVSQPHHMQYHAYWLLAQVYLQDGRWHEARPILNGLIEHSEVYSSMARKSIQDQEPGS